MFEKINAAVDSVALSWERQTCAYANDDFFAKLSGYHT
jgi:hypothetical protein